MRGEFVLNGKADAQECLNFILTQMHTWMQSFTTAPNQKIKAILNRAVSDDPNAKLEDLAKAVDCSYQNGRNQPCFIHEMFYLQHQ